jgi:hypothetical protein
VTRVLADADASGFSVEDVMSELGRFNGATQPQNVRSARKEDLR